MIISRRNMNVTRYLQWYDNNYNTMLLLGCRSVSGPEISNVTCSASRPYFVDFIHKTVSSVGLDWRNSQVLFQSVLNGWKFWKHVDCCDKLCDYSLFCSLHFLLFCSLYLSSATEEVDHLPINQYLCPLMLAEYQVIGKDEMGSQISNQSFRTWVFLVWFQNFILLHKGLNNWYRLA